jgi:hypothetical protein
MTAAVASDEQACKLLSQIAQQIRCCYISKEVLANRPKDSYVKQTTAPKPAYHFRGDVVDPSGEILCFVAARAASIGQRSPLGLFDIVYKLDRSNHVLLLSQQRFVGIAGGASRRKVFQPIAENIDDIVLSFSDGESWVGSWRLEERGELPRAVRVGIIFRDDDGRQRQYMTTAATNCHSIVWGKVTQDRAASGRAL